MKPILFNTEMVRAVLDGRKTVTRRVVKRAAVDDVLSSPARKENPDVEDSRFIKCLCTAPCEPSDILWVRETWQHIPCIDCRQYEIGCVDKPVTYESREAVSEGCFIYRADYPEPQRVCWHPSIHMPREAARLFLRVVAVRVERLKDITPEQIDAEGCKEWAYSATTGELLPSGPSWFSIAWDNTLKPADRALYGWEANPWVWVIEFERISKEEALGGGGE